MMIKITKTGAAAAGGPGEGAGGDGPPQGRGGKCMCMYVYMCVLDPTVVCRCWVTDAPSKLNHFARMLTGAAAGGVHVRGLGAQGGGVPPRAGMLI